MSAMRSARSSSFADRVVLLKQGKLVGAGALNEVLTSLEYRGSFGSLRVGAVLDARVASHEPQYGLTQLAFKGQILFVPLQPVAIGQAVRVHILSSDVSLVVGRTNSPTSVLNILEATIIEIRESISPRLDVLWISERRSSPASPGRSLANLGLKPGQRVFAHMGGSGAE